LSGVNLAGFKTPIGVAHGEAPYWLIPDLPSRELASLREEIRHGDYATLSSRARVRRARRRASANTNRAINHHRFIAPPVMTPPAKVSMSSESVASIESATGDAATGASRRSRAAGVSTPSPPPVDGVRTGPPLMGAGLDGFATMTSSATGVESSTRDDGGVSEEFGVVVGVSTIGRASRSDGVDSLEPESGVVPVPGGTDVVGTEVVGVESSSRSSPSVS
jgi:hypothetical protein